ncbi:MAG: tetratricopeptide repeat protein [Alphaproteobacteria bacterium]|nr:tetratricopeptide repeat protein [Alphaproteobacteria bacterium]
MLTPLLWWLVAGAAEPSSPESLLRHGQVAEALSAAGARAHEAPTDVAAQELYVDLLLNLGMAGRAREEAQARVDAAPTDPDARYLLGRAELDAGAAQAAYEAALRLRPDHARAHMGMGAIHEAKGDLSAARQAFSRAAKEDPALSEAWLGAARTALLAGDLPGGTQFADQGLAACPDEPGLALLSANLHPDRAEALLHDALKRVPDEPRLHESLGWALLKRGAATDGLGEARAALALDPSSEEALRLELVARELTEKRLDIAGWKALEALRGGKGESLTGWDALVAGAPRSALVLLGRGNFRLRTNDGAGAIEDFLAAVGTDPANVEAKAAAGTALLGAKQAARAEPLLAEAYAARPWSSDLGISRWRALVETGQGKAATDFVGELARMHPFDPAVIVAHAGSLVDGGQVQEAYRVIKGGLLLIPDPRLAAAFVQIAPAAGHPEEAAALLDQVVAQTGNPALAEAARKLRGQ